MNKAYCRFFSIFFLTTFLCISCKNKNGGNVCNQFKNGKFIWKSKNLSFSIMREDNIQIEKQIGTNYYTKLKIHWIDECRYEASILESNFPYPDSIQQIRKKIILKTEIIKGTDDYYVFKSHSDQSTEMMIDTLWIDKTR